MTATEIHIHMTMLRKELGALPDPVASVGRVGETPPLIEPIKPRGGRGMQKVLALLVVGAFFIGACGGDKEETESEGEGNRAECTNDLPASADVPDLPSDFPLPGEVLLTGSSQAGPSLIVEGYFQADMEEAFPEYESAFKDAGWDITKDEQEEDDAEIFFAHGDTNGQVNMFAECQGRTKLRITIRPE